MYLHFKCPYCRTRWPEECKCDLLAATLAKQLSEAKAEIEALKEVIATNTESEEKR